MKNFLNSLDRFWNWLVTSSSDPVKTSLAIRGLVVAIIPFVIALLPVFCNFGVCIDPEAFNPIMEAVLKVIEGILYVIQAIATAFAAAMVLWGLLRKLYYARWSATDL